MEPDARAESLMRLMLSLRQAGVTDKRVLTAMESVPRDVFVDRAFKDRAWEDRPLPIACGQTISQPSIVAVMTEALNVTPRCKVLEIGAGSGYQTAILARLARRVYAIERHRPLVRLARERLETLGITNVTIRTGDGTRGWPEQAPFDRILIAAAADDAPRMLLEQLRPGGIMVLPVGQSDEVQQLIRIEKTDEGLDYKVLTDVLFVPLIEGMPEENGP
ncbi:protein-L-isoaspartate(D-aspartate) O-methyltransferase [Limibaculum sp. FT325]|uniref:protein-L-isoaspartate(D-aspartate) O-methyltransferase n=1 Tax=Thermohalobaculum sediminis TaxID=2939436 RepID=UPI00202B8A0C|nr:protein-L-isoaspartate(D-aspartate) O-methyltransferase [Limibaculum sediminis]MCL5775476.1 protein-L-isoaspartate(D-aspartate) O-methyltransferase [Limibaculum sediminis]